MRRQVINNHVEREATFFAELPVDSYVNERVVNDYEEQRQSATIKSR